MKMIYKLRIVKRRHTEESGWCVDYKFVREMADKAIRMGAKATILVSTEEQEGGAK